MKSLFFLLAATMIIAPLINAVYAQATPPPLESKPPAETPPPITSPSLGKVTIQISQTEQIILDLPLKSENKYQIVQIK